MENSSMSLLESTPSKSFLQSTHRKVEGQIFIVKEIIDRLKIRPKLINEETSNNLLVAVRDFIQATSVFGILVDKVAIETYAIRINTYSTGSPAEKKIAVMHLNSLSNKMKEAQGRITLIDKCLRAI